MKQIITFLLLIFISCSAMAQDIITTTDGNNISCKFVHVGKKNVRYRALYSEDTTIHSMPKATVLMIQYADGEKEVFNERNTDEDNEDGTANAETLNAQGSSDAQANYEEYKTAKTVTMVVAAVTGPIFGLIPAVACTSTPPASETLGAPDAKLMKSSDYSHAYKMEARRIKNKKVWNGYIVGVIIDVAAVVLLIAL